MNKTKKALSDGGKKGQKARMVTITLRRHGLFRELTKYVDKPLLDYIQFSRVRWTNAMIEELLEYYRND